MSLHPVWTQQDWQLSGTTVYAVNLEGTNRFSAQVQGGWATDGRLRTDPEELAANARLIAAAPELLKALKIAVRQNSHDMMMTGEELRVCESAIAKATGESA